MGFFPDKPHLDAGVVFPGIDPPDMHHPAEPAVPPNYREATAGLEPLKWWWFRRRLGRWLDYWAAPGDFITRAHDEDRRQGRQ